jgi:hypothetical protein
MQVRFLLDPPVTKKSRMHRDFLLPCLLSTIVEKADSSADYNRDKLKSMGVAVFLILAFG